MFNKLGDSSFHACCEYCDTHLPKERKKMKWLKEERDIKRGPEVMKSFH